MIPYDRPRGAIHDLAHLAELSGGRCRILCVSDRTLYILHNFAALDCTFYARYAVDLHENGYIPVDRDDGPLYDLYEDVVTNFQLEVLDMTCDIQAGLEALADAIRVSGGGGCCPSGNNPVVNCIVQLDDEQLLGPGVSDPGPVGVGTPPEGFATWEEYTIYKCQAAEFIWDLERKHMVALRTFDAVALSASIAGPVIAGLAGVLPAAMTPPGFAVFVASIVAIGIVAAASWFYMDEMIDYWDDNHDEIVCSLYESGNSVEAVSALSNALEDAIQAIVTWGSLEPVADELAGLLGTAFGQLAGNGIVEPLFKAVVSATQYEADCSGCAPLTALCLTALSEPYNALLLGDYVDPGSDESGEMGWESTQSEHTLMYFTPAENVTSVNWAAYVNSDNPTGWTVGVLSIHRASDDQLIVTLENDIKGTDGEWVYYSGQDIPAVMSMGTQYYLFFGGQGGNEFWTREVSLKSA